MSKFDHITTWIFDMDETLYPHQTGETPVKGQSGKAVKLLAAHNNLPEEQVQAQLDALAKTHGDAFAAIRKILPFPFDAWYKQLKDEGLYAAIEPCPEVPELLEQMKQPKILFTNGGNGHVDHVFEQCGFKRDWFDQIITNETHDVLPKPATESYEAVLAAIGTSAHTCAFVEDKVLNLEPAKKLGMTTIQVNTPQSEASYIDLYYAEIKQLLRDIISG